LCVIYELSLMYLVDWDESLYTNTGELVDTINCSELCHSQSDADQFVLSLDKSVCFNICVTSAV